MKLKKSHHLLLTTAILTSALLLNGCYSKRKSVERSLPYSTQMNWPKEYKPEESKFFVHNEIDINATPEVVWGILMQAETWPEWYEGAKNVKVTSNNKGELDSNAVFDWNTMGQDFTSAVQEFNAPFRLSWESKKKNIQGYHTWLIVPTEAGCKLITSEAQHGFLTFMQKVFLPNKLSKLHDIWLLAIKQKAEKYDNEDIK